MKDHLTTAEAAQELGVHIDTARRWSDQGRLPTVRTPGGHRRHPIQAVLQLKGASMLFEYRARSPEWLFDTWDASSPLFPYIVLVRESDVGSLQLGVPMIEHPTSFIPKPNYTVYMVHGKGFDHPMYPRPVYNCYPQHEQERGIVFVSQTTLPFFLINQMHPWLEPAPEFKWYFLPEPQIVGVIEERWTHPRTLVEQSKMAYVVLADDSPVWPENTNLLSVV